MVFSECRSLLVTLYMVLRAGHFSFASQREPAFLILFGFHLYWPTSSPCFFALHLMGRVDQTFSCPFSQIKLQNCLVFFLFDLPLHFVFMPSNEPKTSAKFEHGVFSSNMTDCPYAPMANAAKEKILIVVTFWLVGRHVGKKKF